MPAIPPKPWGRMLDLAIRDFNQRDQVVGVGYRDELESLMDTYGWPHNASPEQLKEWSDLHKRIDPPAPQPSTMQPLPRLELQRSLF